MALITQKEAFRKVPPRHKDVPYPELGGDIRFVEMTAAEWSDFDRDSPHYSLRLIIACARGASGRLFEAADLNKLALWPEHMVERGAKAIMQLHGFLADAELEKNCGPALPNTESPPPSA